MRIIFRVGNRKLVEKTLLEATGDFPDDHMLYNVMLIQQLRSQDVISLNKYSRRVINHENLSTTQHN